MLVSAFQYWIMCRNFYELWYFHVNLFQCAMNGRSTIMDTVMILNGRWQIVLVLVNYFYSRCFRDRFMNSKHATQRAYFTATQAHSQAQNSSKYFSSSCNIWAMHAHALNQVHCADFRKTITFSAIRNVLLSAMKYDKCSGFSPAINIGLEKNPISNWGA